MLNIDKKNYGFTLIEVLVVTTVGLSIIAASLALFKTVMSRLDVGVESDNLETIYKDLKFLFSGEVIDDGFKNSLLIDSKVIPSRMKIIGGDKIINSWNGEVDFKPVGDNVNFSVSYKRVPVGKVCYDLISGQSKIGWSGFLISGDEYVYSDIDHTDLAKKCNSKKGTIDIEFKTGELGI